MHSNKLKVFLGLIAIVFIAYSCKKRKDDNGAVVPVDVYAPTAYILQYPGVVVPKIGIPIESPDNPLTLEGISLGRKLFYDTRLSKDGTISCNSCHGQEHSFDDSRRFSSGVDGALGNRNAMPLINLAWSSRFFWDGRSESLEMQAHDPVSNPAEMAAAWPTVVATLQLDTMYQRLFFNAFGTRVVDSVLVTKAIAQFERTFISFNSRYDAMFFRLEAGMTEEEMRGFEAFNKFGCPACHSDGLLTDRQFRNNGLDLFPADSGLAKFTHIATDHGKFKVPTLRNIVFTAPYMHDGRFATLNDVMKFYSDGIVVQSPNIDSNMSLVLNSGQMTRSERDAIIAFLGTLTDSSFIANTDFRNQ